MSRATTRYLVFDTLYGQDNNFQPHPQMVAGHTVSADGKQWDITLRDGLKFHDDTPVLARDCVASIQRWWQRDDSARCSPPPPTRSPRRPTR